MKLLTELQQIEADYEGGFIDVNDGLLFSQQQTLRMVDFYSNSTYLGSAKYNYGKYGSGKSTNNKDNLGREVPFYNIVNAMVDTAVVATDIDTKDIVVEAENEESYDKSFLFNHEIQQWMKESDFAKALNDMGETRARYGGVVVKKCIEKDEDEGGDKMEIEVVDWKNIITDQVDFENGVKMEKHYLTPNDLRKKADVWENTDEAILLYAKKGYTKVAERLEVWEVEGVFPISYLSEEAECTGDDEDYSLQHHFFCVKGEKATHLFWEELKESQYKYLPWKRVAGRMLGRGVVEEGEESQVWTNDAIQKEQAAIDLSGRVILKTSSKKVGNNVLTDLDNGSIVYVEDGKEFEVMNLLNGALPQFQNLVDKWWSQYERATASYDAIRGETPPSGQPYRLQALVTQTGSSHFDYRREEWGIFLKELFYDWVFPYLEGRLNKKHILASDFTPEELLQIDQSYAKYNARQYAIERIMNGSLITMQDYMMTLDQYMQSVATTGTRRFLDIPKDYYKDMEAKLSINITGENKNKQAIMETLSNILQTVAMNPGVLQDPTMSMVFNKILETSGVGISPLSLNKGGMQQQMGSTGKAPQNNTQNPGAVKNEVSSLQPQGAQKWYN